MTYWWARESAIRCDEDIHKKASTYIIVSLLVLFTCSSLAAYTIHTCRILFAVGAAVIGTNLAHKKCTCTKGALSLLLHLLPIVLALNRSTIEERRRTQAVSMVLAGVMGTLVLIVYYVNSYWPYPISPLTMSLIGASVMVF